VGAWPEALGVERPIVQAGMGGGLAPHALAVAVSEAGGLGTIGFVPAGALRAQIAAARRRTKRPLGVNLPMPFARQAHVDAADQADVVVTFWGRPRRQTAKPWMRQAGSLQEALEACSAGADAIIAQGIEAGGHVRGVAPATDLLARVREALPDDYPVLSAGGIADAADVRSRLAAGAEAVVCGTRFLMTEESAAHPAYKARLVESGETVVTELFGAGWPAPHRVLRNAATEHWLRNDPRGPGWLRTLNRLTAPAASRLPMSQQQRLLAAQRPNRPIFGPSPPLADSPPRFVDAAPLYAGETVARIGDVRAAGELVAELAR
jgi:NAD(P)H-dependent flavin oxidoreductase YrpB (nitropropane dioxygenase family)